MAGVSPLKSRLARGSARAFFVALTLAGLTGCDFIAGDMLETPAGSGTFQVLPLRAFLTRPNVHADAMQFCRKEVCGYDAASGRITAYGADAKALHDSLSDRAGLLAALTKPRPAPKNGPAPPPIAVETMPVTIGAWSGLRLSLEGGLKHHRAFGIIVEKPVAGGSSFIIVVASTPEMTQRLAQAATAD